MDNDSGRERNFVPNVLPWIIAAVALLTYAATLNHWVSLTNMSYVARASGWSWEPDFFSPLYLLATYPLRWLPLEWIPLALNLFSAMCAVLVIGQLARSVALLPHDRTHEQRLREQADYFMLSGPLSWLPPILAVMACGLQLTFWEQGTNGSPEMFNLLIFSYVVRSLLEFRLDGRDARLYRTALLYGAGMANDWAMVGFLPVFLIALGWIRGLSFFNFRFLARMILFGLLGMTAYLLLPIIAIKSHDHSVGFWLTLKTNVILQKDYLMFFPRKTFVLFALFSLVPVILLSIRWASYFGDSSRLGTVTTTWVFHVVHVVFLLACTWTVFDPPFGPRHRAMDSPPAFSSLSFLTFYYLGALSIGYYSGYFLVVFQSVFSRGRRVVPIKSLPNTLAHALVIGLAILIPVGLIWKNLPEIRITNGPLLKELAATEAEDLPADAAILSDDSRCLTLVRSWLARVRKGQTAMFIDTHSLAWPEYHRYLVRKYSGKWRETVEPGRDQIYSPGEMARQITNLSRTEELWYLQPSFGYYFESFYYQPHGVSYQLTRYATNMVLAPELDPQGVDSNQKFWTQMAHDQLPSVLEDLKTDMLQSPPTARQIFLRRLRLPLDPNSTVTFVAAFYSRALDYWGRQTQAHNLTDDAINWFDLAIQTKADNVVAEINLDASRKLRAGQNSTVTISRSLDAQFQKYRSWEQILNDNGPYDEPNFCYAAGYTYLNSRLYRQAALEFDRVSGLLPNDPISRMLLAQVCLLARQPGQVLAITDEIHGQPQRFALSGTNAVDLAGLEATANFQLRETNAAIAALEHVANSPDILPESLGKIAIIYWQNGLYKEALKTLDRQVAMAPVDLDARINKSYVYSLMHDYDHAVLALNQVLKNDPDNPSALLDRAIAEMYLGRLDEAKTDYTRLQGLFPSARQTYYGLGEIAWRRKDTNDAVANYEAYLTNAIPGSREAMMATNRLNELKGVK